jgi:uncharacterized OB-fold protein
MMELLRWSGPSGLRLAYQGGRPRDIDAPVLAADTLGRVLADDERRPAVCRIFANGHTDGLQRLWPMVEAVAGRTVDAAFVGDTAEADLTVEAEVGAHHARVEARWAGMPPDLQKEPTVVMSEPAAALAPEIGGLDMPAWWLREEQDLVGLRGRRCPGCGRVEYPAPPAGCPRCGGGLEPHVLATTGRVVTWTVDRLYESRVATGMVVVDLDGGGRFYGQLADGVVTGDVTTGSVAQLVPRVLHADERRTAYFWKVTIGGEVRSA